MARGRTMLIWIPLAWVAVAPSVVAALDPPHDVSQSIDCGNCHITHHAPGGEITTVAGNANLCISCHSAGGSGASHPFANADEAIPGTGGTSHRWDSGAAGRVQIGSANTSPGTVQPAGSFTGRYTKTYTITVTTAGDAGTALFSWSTSKPSSLTYLDGFPAIAYNGTGGTQNWSGTPWQEVGEANGPTAGFAQVVTSAACASASGNCLRLGGGSIAGIGVQRGAAVSAGTAATLTFSYARQLATCPNTSTANVAVQASANGSTWATLATYNLNACDAAQVAQVFDLTPYLGPTMQIRFLGAGTAGATDFIYVDNVQVQYLAPGGGAANVTTGANVALDEGVSVTFTNGTPSPSFKLNDQWTIFVNRDINPPTTFALAATLAGTVATCSTCHNQHSQLAEPFDRAAPAYPLIGPGGAGRHYQRLADDIDQMCVDCHSVRNVTAASQGSHPVGITIPTSGLYKNP